jgi:exodeoxyribonuclease-5
MDNVATFADTGLSAEQEGAVAAIDDFVADRRRQVFVLHGLAGTGKTTLLAHVAHQYDHAALTALTGKAANVLRGKTGLEAGTIHGYFYRLLEAAKDEHGRTHLTFTPRHYGGELNGDLVLVDEASMVPRSIGWQLMKTGAKVIAASDPGQLPPVKEAPFFNTPDVTLRQIHRQAWKSPIIRQAMEVRHGRPYRSAGADFQVIGGIGDAELRWADVVLCWKNATRRRLNRVCRRLTGHLAPHHTRRYSGAAR